MRHVVSLIDLSSSDILEILQLSKDLKSKFEAGTREPILAGFVMALLFEKPSLRTRVSFETGIRHMGGSSLFLGNDVGFGKRESIEDFAQVLSSYTDVIVCRAKRHETVVQLASHSTCPVINGLTDYTHPCQALADLLTIREYAGSLDYQKVAYVGDANNVARSLVTACAKLGVPISVATPKGFEFDEPFLERLKVDVPDHALTLTHDAAVAVKDATAVYTDVWVSMGQEAEKAERLKKFADYQVNSKLMKLAAPQACFLHCLPAHRGEEVTAEVIDGPQSVVIQQAENRMHAQKGLMAWLLT